MKPRNKYEIHITELQKKLPKITEEHKVYNQENSFDSFAAIARNRLFCLECNHKWGEGLKKWQYDLIESVNCPECKRKLSLIRHASSLYRDEAYLMVLHKVGGFQVLRMIYTQKFMYRNKLPEHISHEVVQKWINPTGKVTIFAKSFQGLNGYGGGTWSLNSDLSIKADVRDNKYTILPHRMYPKKQIIKNIRRNGFKSSCHNMFPDKLFRAILKDPQSETLLKAKQYKLLTAAIRYGNINNYWPSIKICIRNNYIVKDTSLWIDYIDLLTFFNKDTSNSKYVCPKDLKYQHDKFFEKKKKWIAKKKEEELRDTIKESQLEYCANKQHFFSLSFKDRNLTISVFNHVKQFLKESEMLSHCAFVSEYYNKKDSLILSARIDNKIVETVEISLNSMEIIQSRGYKNNATKYNQRIIKLLNKNMKQIEAIHKVA